MTDKQIIIDGVPVQDCCYFDYENDGYEDSCYIHQNECSAQNCYYKQLKRKEQECSFNTLKIIALQEALEQYETENDQLKRKEGIINILEQECTEKMDIIIALGNKLTAKEQECEELKEKQRCAWKSLEGTFCPEAQQQLDQLKAENDELKKKVYKYEQAEKYPAAFLWQEGLL